MRKKNLVYICLALIIILIGSSIFIIILISNNRDKKHSGVERNYGLSYQSSDINIKDGESSNERSFDASTVVPSKNELISNLKNKGFEIEYFEKVFDSNIKASQILATKGEHFVNISYDIEDEGEYVFDLYNEHYNEDKYYILALNGSYVYAISDLNTFKDAGFTSLANDGRQFINDSNK